jgi:hypothetical protein
MPFMPFPEIDVLVVEEMGKNFSGTGMDSNVINPDENPRRAGTGGSRD